MEVHHHPHVEKKRFKDYLLEGLMIFIAVTIGFFAESLRESLTNREKEVEYIHSLINNLEQDDEIMRSAIHDNQRKLTGLDSLLSLAAKNSSDATVRASLYSKSTPFSITFYAGFTSNDATMMQLKNSGGLQFIKKKGIADSIALYDLVTRSIYAAERPYSTAIDNATNAMNEILIARLMDDSSYFKKDIYTGKPLPLLTDDPKKIEIFYNKIGVERGWTQNYINNLKENEPYLARLIVLLKKEYHI